MIIWYLDLQLPEQSVPITTTVGRSNAVHGEVYSVQHHEIKLVSDWRQISMAFFEYSGFLTIKSDRHDITEILLKVALSTLNHKIFHY
jgi:hypothetical protein